MKQCLLFQFKMIWQYTLISIIFAALIVVGLQLMVHAERNEKTKLNSGKIQDFNFVASGDFGCNDNANKTIIGMITKRPKLFIGLGDYSYGNRADCWFKIISQMENTKNGNFRMVLGEHDVADNPTKYDQYRTHFNLTKPFYSFDYQNVHFLIMTTAKNKIIPYSNNSEQYAFIEKDLEKTSQNKNINWIVAFSFKPFYSSKTSHPGEHDLREIYHPLFNKYGVDIVLQAHNHNYQRTYPLTFNATKQVSPIIIDTNTNEYNNIKEGQIFLTAGTGGEKLHNFTGQEPFVIKQFLRHGFLDLRLTKKGSELSIAFYDSEKGKQMDHFIIKKKIK